MKTCLDSRLYSFFPWKSSFIGIDFWMPFELTIILDLSGFHSALALNIDFCDYSCAFTYLIFPIYLLMQFR